MSRFRHFHEGEAQVQASAGVDTAAYDQAVDEAFQPAFSASEVEFVGDRTFSVAASIDADRRPWASPLVGRSGELFRVVDETNVRIAPNRIDGDPLFDNVAATAKMGVLYFDPSRRRRAKSLGRGTIESDGTISYQMHRNFGICPKYIFKRDHDAETPTDQPGDPSPRVASQLGEADRRQLTQTDTAFLASHSEMNGADATHRGGPAGFVTVVDNTTLELPDYAGNGMFQTLGNLLLDNRIGFLTIDFESGRVVQVTGHGETGPADAANPYSERTLRIAIDQVRSSFANVGIWTEVEAFTMRPGLGRPALR